METSSISISTFWQGARWTQQIQRRTGSDIRKSHLQKMCIAAGHACFSIAVAILRLHLAKFRWFVYLYKCSCPSMSSSIVAPEQGRSALHNACAV